MKTNQKGFGIVEILILMVFIVLVCAVGWLFYDRLKDDTADDTTNTQTNVQTKTADPYEGWTFGTFEFVNMSYKLPPGWQDITLEDSLDGSGFREEDFTLKASDGFILSMSVNNYPRGLVGGGDEVPTISLMDFKNIDGGYQWLITDDGNNQVGAIYVGRGAKKIGEKTFPYAYRFVRRDDLNIEFEGHYENELSSITDFNNKESVKEAKLVFESLKFD